MDLIFDLETLGVKRRDVVIVSIACVPFDITKQNTFDELEAQSFFRKLDIRSQLKTGATVEESTMEWWSKQSEEARRFSIKFSETDVDNATAFTELADFVKSVPGYDYKNSFIWSRGIAFDMPKIEYQMELLAETGVDVPVNFWKARDIRTFLDTLTGQNTGTYTCPEVEEAIARAHLHHALHDAIIDAIRMQQLYKLLFN